MRWKNLASWWRAHPLAADAALALVLTGGTLISMAVRWRDPAPSGYRASDAGGVLLALLALAPVVVRRRYPVSALVAMTVGLLASQGVPYTDHGQALGVLVGAYSVAAYAQPRITWRWAVGYMAVLSGWIAVGIATGAPNARAGDIVATNVVYGTSWIVGDNVRRRREHVHDLEERALRLERERELEAREARTRERAAIARELHDVVAHSMTVMVVQASGARRALTKHPAAAADALRVIEETGRSSLVEMRRVLGILRDGDSVDFLPQPSVQRIEELTTGDVTVPVEVHTSGEVRELTPAVDVSAYRIVQEALTNVRKHGGPQARATVHLDYGADALTVRVDDTGRGAMTLAATAGPGHGLVGMRERVAVCGGTLRAGPRRGGGWTVAATLPYVEQPRTTPVEQPRSTPVEQPRAQAVEQPW